MSFPERNLTPLKWISTQFGAVTVNGIEPSSDLVDLNILRSSEALKNLAKALTQPGVSLPPRKGVAEYYASESGPNILVRHLDGEIQHGQIVGKVFIPLPD